MYCSIDTLWSYEDRTRPTLHVNQRSSENPADFLIDKTYVPRKTLVTARGPAQRTSHPSLIPDPPGFRLTEFLPSSSDGLQRFVSNTNSCLSFLSAIRSLPGVRLTATSRVNQYPSPPNRCLSPGGRDSGIYKPSSTGDAPVHLVTITIQVRRRVHP